MSINDQDREVASYLKAIGTKYQTILTITDHATDDDWKCDQWLIVINGQPVDYRTGTGHRIARFNSEQQKEIRERCELVGAEPREVCKDTKELKRNPKGSGFNFEKYARTVPPTHASVIYSLLLDAQSGRETFNEFCGNYGYGSDSRSAEKIYFACQDASEKLNKAFTTEQQTKLAELLEDY